MTTPKLTTLRGFSVMEAWDGERENLVPSYKKVFEESSTLPEDEIEGAMYDVAAIVDEESTGHDWVTVVAYSDGAPIVAIDFGRRYEVIRDGLWDPSRDYWHGEEISPELREEVCHA